MALERDTMYSLRMPGKVRKALQRAADSERRTVATLLLIMAEEGLQRRGFWKPEKRPTRKGG